MGGATRVRAGVKPDPAALPGRSAMAAAIDSGSAVEPMVQEWLSLDTDADSRAAVGRLVAEGKEEELQDIMGSRLEFGTAGLRGLMGPGFNRMNLVTVQQTTQGLCRYLQAKSAEQLATGGFVIGYDGRHSSMEMATIAAAVMLSQGVPVHLFSDLVPTPFVAFAVEQLGCAGGVMVTASHNPKEYNGYKVYWGNGCQIVPPHDNGIATAILDNLPLWDVSAFMGAEQPGLSDPLEEVASAYYAALREALLLDVAVPDGFRVTYTPLHGVGGKWLQRAFREFNLPEPVMTEEQAQPDAEFPTVKFPNPEEGDGTWSLCFQAAEKAGTPLAVANDPDADRLAVAERDPSLPLGWRTFSGNEIGILLADWALTVFREKNPGVPMSEVAMLTTIVSSKMMAAMAAKEGFRFEQTLTGFKWLGNVAKDLEAQGYRTVFAFEEAIGFMFGTFEKDKDGISAAVAFTQMAARLAAEGTTVSQHLAALQQRYGTFVGRQSYFVAERPAQSAAVFDGIRSGGNYPESLGGFKISSVRDLGVGLDSSQPDGKAVLPWIAGDLNITFTFEVGAELTLRASGTEPKLKYYLEVSGGGSEAELQERAALLEAAISTELVKPEESGLKPKDA
eukprot:jgi/Tetstr1/424338/TSEL_014903.t2